MVSKKTLSYIFNGYRAPIIPRAPRSIRKATHKNPVEDSKLSAFELLAAVAGKLLEESESSASSNVAEGNDKGNLIDDKALNSESFDHGSCVESVFVPEISLQDQNLFFKFKGKSHLENVLKKVDLDMKLGDCDFKNANENPNCRIRGSVCAGDSFNSIIENGPKLHFEDGICQIDELSMEKTSDVKEPNEVCVNSSNMLINLDSSVQLPMYRVPGTDAFLQKHSTDVKIGISDDDDNSSRCNKSSTKVRPFNPQPRVEHRSIRKMLTYKYRKLAPKRKGYEFYNTCDKKKSLYQCRKRIYTRERCQQAPMKKRRLSDHRFSVAYDRDTSSNRISNLPDNGSKTANGTVKVHQKAKDPHVKFSIKSFKVPELYIEVPETASVCSLKRSVIEAVTAIFGSGIRVGVVLQGKKLRDDNRTLQQSGICQSSNLDTVGFTLEPCFTHVSPSVTAKKNCSVLPCEGNLELPRSPAAPVIDSGISDDSVDTLVIKFDDHDRDNKNRVISSPQTTKKEVIDEAHNNALVQMNAGPLAVDAKPKRTELSQRRTRRPFSVTEVEALVGAVEKLGTGRWRDVKIGAFGNADHRTYVDLKDKWKTLVHTASISLHQRRGEPVPQELLDRVLSAHSYWTQHPSKQIVKPSVVHLKTFDEEIVGA